MLQLLAIDTVFVCAAFVEALAVFSLARRFGIGGSPFLLDPVLAFYNERILPVPAAITYLIPATLPGWFADAYILSFVFFYLFFIRQAEIASAPESGGDPSRDDPQTRAERITDGLLPVLACFFGAFLAGLTLLPLATPLLALVSLLRRAAGVTSSFHITRAYYLNVMIVIGAACAFAYAGRL